MEADARKLSRPALWGIALLALFYGSAHLFWYWGTPLGRAAVLDERENLQLAAQITAGTLPPEPFYRAMGYPLFLAALRTTGLLTDEFPQAATAAGLLLHVIGTLLVARLAQRWFASARAGLAAGLLHGLNPVLIHHATQILDGTLADTFFLTGLLFLPVHDEVAPSRRNIVCLSLAWTAAALVRPQFLLLWLALPVVWVCAAGPGREWRKHIVPAAVALAAGGALWAALGCWQWRTSGEFRLLPWQGAYNLWAANKAGANGRYYTQSVLRESTDDGTQTNPAQVESLMLHPRAAGDTGPLRVDAFNEYWRRRITDETLAHPGAWLRLELRKLYYLLNNAEQYNNKTYAFHKELSPWLRFNPLCWGVLLLAGVLGLLALGPASRPLLFALLLTIAVVAASLLLFFVSARFRLPLVVLFCVLAGGAVGAPRRWWPASHRGWFVLLPGLSGLAVCAFSNWFGAGDITTYFQDHMLIAGAAEKTGEDRITWDETRIALALRPGYRDALRLSLTSYLNLLLTGPQPRADEMEWRRHARELYALTPVPADHAQANVMALALWRDHDRAGLALWRIRVATHDDPESLAALCLAGAGGPDAIKRLVALPMPATPGTFVLMAKARYAPTELQHWAEAHEEEALPAALRQATENLFPVQS